MDLKSPFLPTNIRSPLAIRVITPEGAFIYDIKDPLAKHVSRWRADWEYLYSGKDLPAFKTTLTPELEKRTREYIKYLHAKNPNVSDDWETQVALLMEELLRLHVKGSK
jgi:hypothetical protein